MWVLSRISGFWWIKKVSCISLAGWSFGKLRAVKLWGVDSVNISKKRKEFVWGEFPALLDFNILEKSVNTIGLDELLNVYPDILKGNLKHKIVVDVNK